MIDLLSLGVTHALLMIAAWRLVRRPDLDSEETMAAPRDPMSGGWGRSPDA